MGPIDKGFKRTIFLWAVIFSAVLIVAGQIAFTGSDRDTSGHDQALIDFESTQNLADDDARETFKFLYYNVPNDHKKTVLSRYKELLARESKPIDKKRLIEITEENMPEEMPLEFRVKIIEDAKRISSTHVSTYSKE